MGSLSSISKLLKEGRIPPLRLLEKAIKNFLGLDLKEQTALVVHGRKIPQVRELLRKFLPLGRGLKTSLLEGRLTEISIPTVDKISNEGKLSKVYLIDHSPIVWTNAEEYHSVLVSKLKPLTGKNFIVLFEEKYEGYSFLLPLAVGLLKPQLLEKYCFSGDLTAEGKLIPVEGIRKKQTACGEKLLITADDFSELKRLLEYLENSPKAVPFLVSSKGKSDSELKNDYLSLVEHSKVYPSEGFFRRVFNTPPYKELGFLNTRTDWKNALKFFEELIRKIDSTFEDSHLHLSLIAPSPLAFAYGIMHGNHKRVTFYHYQGGKYFPVVVINEETSREIKRFIDNPKRVEAEFFPFKGMEKVTTLSVVLDMVSHPIKGSVLNFLKGEGIASDILVIHHKEKGILKPDRLWTEDIAETFTLIRKYFSEKPYEKINFFFGTPVAFAFGLGVAFGHYAKGSVYSFYRERSPQYVEVLRLEEIRKVR